MAEIIWRIKENKTGEVTNTYKEISSDFPKITSCSALKERFKEYDSRRYVYYVDDMILEEADGETATAPMMKGDEAEDYSETNVQVAGVDEADVIKNGRSLILEKIVAEKRVGGCNRKNYIRINFESTTIH